MFTMTVLIAMIMGGLVISSFATTVQEEQKKCVQLEMNAPTYWEGWVQYSDDARIQIHIKVYQSDGMCNSFYAIKSDNNEEMWVKENPDYDRNSPTWWKTCRYYVTYHNKNYYFNM